MQVGEMKLDETCTKEEDIQLKTGQEEREKSFHPISLTGLMDDDDDDDDDGDGVDADNDEEQKEDDVMENNASLPRVHPHDIANESTVVCPPSRLLPSRPKMNENAIEECFCLAIQTHNTDSSLTPEQEQQKPQNQQATVWHWDPDHYYYRQRQLLRQNNNNLAPVDIIVEQEALRSWIPRPLELPTWALCTE